MPTFESDMSTNGHTIVQIRMGRTPAQLDGTMLEQKEKWPTTAVVALEWSILKWKFIFDDIARVKPEDRSNYTDGGCKTCALCQLFKMSNSRGECVGCPVAQQSETAHCNLTPYEDWESNPCPESAEKELRFLESLKDIAARLHEGTLSPARIETENDEEYDA